MATSQMPAATTSGRYMSALVKSVSPALKLMNVLTTATDASEIPVAAGIPRSRTRPDVCRTNSRVGSELPTLGAPAGTDASLLLVTGLPPAAAPPGRGTPSQAGRARVAGPDGSLRLTSWSGQDKRLSIPMNIRPFAGHKGGRTSGSRRRSRHEGPRRRSSKGGAPGGRQPRDRDLTPRGSALAVLPA